MIRIGLGEFPSTYYGYDKERSLASFGRYPHVNIFARKYLYLPRVTLNFVPTAPPRPNIVQEDKDIRLRLKFNEFFKVI